MALNGRYTGVKRPAKVRPADREDGFMPSQYINRNVNEWEDAGSLPCALPPDWMKDALCAAPEHRGLDFTDNYTVRERAVCMRCPVREACLQWAIDTNQPSGLWGGLGPDQRKGMKEAA